MGQVLAISMSWPVLVRKIVGDGQLHPIRLRDMTHAAAGPNTSRHDANRMRNKCRRQAHVSVSILVVPSQMALAHATIGAAVTSPVGSADATANRSVVDLKDELPGKHAEMATLNCCNAISSKPTHLTP